MAHGLSPRFRSFLERFLIAKVSNFGGKRSSAGSMDIESVFSFGQIIYQKVKKLTLMFTQGAHNWRN
jgi:hypothetical protein